MKHSYDFEKFPLTVEEKRGGYTQKDIDALSHISKMFLRNFNTHPQRDELRPLTIKELKKEKSRFKKEEEDRYKRWKAREEATRIENERLEAYADRVKTPKEIAEKEKERKRFNKALFAAMKEPFDY